MDYLEKGTQRYNDRMVDNAPYVKVDTAIVTASGIDGYTVKLNGVEYTNVLAILTGTTLAVNDTVQVLTPNNQLNNIFILGKLG